MKRFKSTVTMYLGFLIIAVVANACCERNFLIVGNGRIEVYEFESIQEDEEGLVVVLDSGFKVEVNYERERTASNFEIDLIQGAYAFSCDDNDLNALLEDTLEYSFDRPFEYNGTSFLANSNLRETLAIQSYTVRGSRVTILFSDAFLELGIFENEVYNFKIQIKTDDNREFENSVAVKFQ